MHLRSSSDCCAGTAISSNKQAIESEDGKAPFTVRVRPPFVETEDGFISLIVDVRRLVPKRTGSIVARPAVDAHFNINGGVASANTRQCGRGRARRAP